MDYEKKYKEALERARLYYCDGVKQLVRDIVSYIFPELKKSEDKTKDGEQEKPQVYETKDGKIITYSENEGYKVVEPKFNVGDWVVLLTSDGEKIVQIGSIEYFKSVEPRYITSEGKWFGNGIGAHLWTIKDARDGDILSYVTDEEDLWIMIYWSLYEPYEGHVHYHALLVNDSFSDKGTCCICIDDLKPATKEQSELLFQRMKEAGYEFDFEKKELKKLHIIDEGKAEMDYCFTKMMNGEKVSSAWSEEDEKNWLGIIDEIEANKSDAPDYDLATYDRFLYWLESLKQRMR